MHINFDKKILTGLVAGVIVMVVVILALVGMGVIQLGSGTQDPASAAVAATDCTVTDTEYVDHDGSDPDASAADQICDYYIDSLGVTAAQGLEIEMIGQENNNYLGRYTQSNSDGSLVSSMAFLVNLDDPITEILAQNEMPRCEQVDGIGVSNLLNFCIDSEGALQQVSE